MGTRKEDISALRKKYGGDENWYSDETPQHRLHLDTYAIAITPVTNAQYALFVADAGAEPPEHWNGSLVPRGLENHPVVYVGWHAAIAYCQWLSAKTGQTITLPSEAEWEKAARGADGREFPWGNEWRDLHCNSDALGLGETTPVGLFQNGASPDGVLDLSGNVWEWTRSLYKNYQYNPQDGRESLEDQGVRVLRGGSFDLNVRVVRCAARYWDGPDNFYWYYGFRVALLLSP
jgi:formylglycine-generating enzyme required for sulfatase activity